MPSVDEFLKMSRDETIKVLVTGAIVAIGAYFLNQIAPEQFWKTSHTSSFTWTYQQLTIYGAILVIAALILTRLAHGILRQHSTVTGRENAMAANVALITKRLRHTSQILRSTRVTHWKLADNAQGKLDFRSALTVKISQGFPVRRLWQIKDFADFQRLEHYLAEYAPYDNYSVKAIVTDKVLIPEILCIGDDAGSLSLPEATSPREMARALYFFARREVDSINRYFDVLWELATPIKIANKVSPEGLVVIRAALTGAPDQG